MKLDATIHFSDATQIMMNLKMSGFTPTKSSGFDTVALKFVNAVVSGHQ